MRLAITVPTVDPRAAGDTFADLEAAGYDTGFSFESKHDPFLPLASAAGRTERLRLGTAVAIGFARNPVVLAQVANDLQLLTEGRFVLGLGSQVRPHIVNRFGETWSAPAARMRELVEAIRAVWTCWADGSPLRFEGEHYRHTLMTPAFDPGPNPFGPPPVFIGGFGPRMVGVAGAVADGLLVHPFTTRRSLQELVLPALAAGAEAAGRPVGAVEVVWVTNVVTWDSEDERRAVVASMKGQLSFYGSTPAYASTLELHGYGDLHRELNALSKQGRWDEMAERFPDELLDELAVVGPRDEVAGRLVARAEGITDSVGLVNSRHPDPSHWADVVADLRRRTA